MAMRSPPAWIWVQNRLLPTRQITGAIMGFSDISAGWQTRIMADFGGGPIPIIADGCRLPASDGKGPIVA
jgi:hypothetical protein